MNKIKVVLGKANSGKSTIAKAMSIKFKEVVSIDARTLKSHWNYSKCNEDTKVIVFDDVDKVEDAIYLIHSTFSGIVINKQCHKLFTINPHIIIVCRENISREDLSEESVLRRIEIIETL